MVGGGGGGLIRGIKIPQQELEPKMQGGLIREGGGRNCGILRCMHVNLLCEVL